MTGNPNIGGMIYAFTVKTLKVVIQSFHFSRSANITRIICPRPSSPSGLSSAETEPEFRNFPWILAWLALPSDAI